mmetsp:Transcript_125386/g.401553  ORF Transcript_125386/g.401553 Transcript_125386/m.401553 type:complete len:345 (-) Transcript_125386:180-1214(-)|eukprot:CAMPEP_0203932226 /NCGR_PEP_ID=MMETSP0359-20131031/70657_1 /ASSEMBLY_ACC=CAM_ASM_000338 /TAXON_ID=268821 /ORGANISM="Scrippsiella Hangoei, Strain SHTV-5" /LENGTH=344 /DNA_ID=CAMNT_0050861651 /DNA_START=95 /DNA_END=1129 /DNA_ORIENTATION=+
MAASAFGGGGRGLFGGGSGLFKRGLEALSEDLAAGDDENTTPRGGASGGGSIRRLKLQRPDPGAGMLGRSGDASASSAGALPMGGGGGSGGGGGIVDREGLVARLFRALDEVNGPAAARGRLSSGKLRRYAELRGFDGDGDEWAVEFSEMCADYKWDARAGVDLAQFAQFVNNPKEGGAFATDQELIDLLPSVHASARGSGGPASPSAAGGSGTRKKWLTRQKSGDPSKDPAAEGSAAPGQGAALTPEDVRVVLERSLGSQAKIDALAARLVARMAERVMDEVVGAAARIARHRGSNTLEASDLRLTLGRDCGLWAPPMQTSSAAPAASMASQGVLPRAGREPT